MSDTHTLVIKTINEVCRPERPNLSDLDEPLLAGELDSLDFASVLIALEDELKISFADVDVESVATINKLVAYIETQRAK